MVRNESILPDPSIGFLASILRKSEAFPPHSNQLCRVFLGPVYTYPYRAAGTRTYKKLTPTLKAGFIAAIHSFIFHSKWIS